MFSCSRLARAAPSWPCTGLALPSGVFRSPVSFLSFVLLRFHRYTAPTPSTMGVPTNRASCQRGSPVPDCGSTGFEAAMIYNRAIVSQPAAANSVSNGRFFFFPCSEVTDTPRNHGIPADKWRGLCVLVVRKSHFVVQTT